MNCWLLNFICRYIPLKQWLLMIPILPNIKNSKLMNSHVSLTSGRTGLTRNSSLTLKNVTLRKYAPSAAALNVTSRSAASSPAFAPPSLSSTRITVPKGSFSVRSVMQSSLKRKAASLL